MEKVLYIGVAIIALVLLYLFVYVPLQSIKIDEPVPMAAAEPGEDEKSGAMQVVGTTGHPASGTVRIVAADEKQYVRYENFKTINGPDLYVYLSKDLEAREFINLGPIKATEGNINYEIPEGTNLTEYRYVLTWCRAFSVLFNSAEIS